VSSIVEGSVAVHRPQVFYLTKIDHWFSHKWLAFSGKALGAVGCWKSDLTIPPFVQSRIVEQWRFERLGDSERYAQSTLSPNIHYEGRSEDNLHRFARRIAPNAALFWYSADTQATGQGSLMGYIPVEKEYWIWYLGLQCHDEWQVLHRKGIHEYEVQMFLNRGLSDSSMGDRRSSMIAATPPAEAGSPHHYFRSTDQ
jgi:hypothetical protein